MTRIGLDAIEVRGVWLRREGDHAVVLVERGDRWIEIIREGLDGPFSHICEPEGIASRERGEQGVAVAAIEAGAAQSKGEPK